MTYNKPSSLLILALVFSMFTSNAQDGIGIGTLNPDKAAILHIEDPLGTRGVLLPDVPNSAIVNMLDANGLLVYERNTNRFAFNKNGTWMFVNPWDTDDIDGGAVYTSTPYNVGIKTSGAPTEAFEVVGTVKATTLDGNGVVPVGGIIMWSGSSANVPANFAICNGSNGTPDLRGRFIMGGTQGAPGGGVSTASTTAIEFTEQDEYIINGTTCQVEPRLYSFSFDQVCTEPGLPPYTIPININNVREFSCAGAQAPYQIGAEPCINTNFSACTVTSNPNFYQRAACRTPGFRRVNAVTTTENRPAYYQLAFIMRLQ